MQAFTRQMKSRHARVFPYVQLIPNSVSKDVAESLGIANLPDTVSSALASDVEYRIHQVVEVRSGLHFCRLTG